MSATLLTVAPLRQVTLSSFLEVSHSISDSMNLSMPVVVTEAQTLCLRLRVSYSVLGSVPAISLLYACRYVIWKLCASVILLNIVLGIVIKSYFSAVGFAMGGGGNTGDGGVDKLLQDIDRNQV